MASNERVMLDAKSCGAPGCLQQEDGHDSSRSASFRRSPFYSVGSRAEVWIDSDSWGHSYVTGGEILGFVNPEGP